MTDRLVLRLRRFAIAGLAGAIAGLLVGGFGGRLFMRIAAILSPEARGRITEAGEIVGVVSLDGTVSLFVFGGLFGGLVASVIWIAVSDRLPPAGRLRILAAAIVGVAVMGPLVVRSDSVDFRILEGDAIVIALILTVVALAAAGLAWLEALLDRRLPVPQRPTSRSGIAYGAIVLLGLAPVVPVTVGAFTTTLGCGCSQPQPQIGAGVALAAIASAVGWAREVRTGRLGAPTAARWIGRAGVAGAVVLGSARLVEEAARIIGG